MFRSSSVIFLGAIVSTIVLSCDWHGKTSDVSAYASLNDSTAYVGIQACRQCHADKYETFSQTGMGLSFDHASRKKSSAVFSSHALVRDTIKGYSYFPFWKNDSLKVIEFRLEGKDTTYKRIETVSWIVGSGQHTNSHLMNVNNYVYQVPMTFYTQKKQWDLPPGFENGFNSRFSRKIGLECITCHNSFPKMELGSENKFTSVPNGIDCERCHGPGGKHVKDKQEGKIVDVSKSIDYSIVNPAKLPISLQLDICQRCHIQGNAVLKDGKSFFDFRPGMKLSDVMNVYMPIYTGDDQSHIMASHAERMKMSKCFLVSEKRSMEENEKHPSLTPYKNAMTCVTCHNPHVSVRLTDQSVFNSKCKSCHSASNNNENSQATHSPCKESLELRLKNGDNCVQCHMPKNGTVDIPHVTTTDHWIRIPVTKTEKQKIKEFAGLVCINNKEAEELSKGEAYLSYFEKFSDNPAFLDSAKKYIDDSSVESRRINFSLLIRWAFLKNDFNRLIQFVEEQSDALALLKKMTYSNDHAWTAYRIGDSYKRVGNNSKALLYFRRAVELAPYQLDFRNKLANALLDADLVEESRRNYEWILTENPEYASAYVNLGFLVLSIDKNTELADRYYDKALSFEPDNVQALLNKAGLRFYQKKPEEAKKFLREVLKRDKFNKQALSLLNPDSKVFY